ncbi:Gfo/Idh/MocA family oxidoreductase [Alphaproteobacteria bacterium]|nr:Gfo/Idh/MocA family oxidoreductase [Alphaproteobacteria bacterium]
MIIGIIGLGQWGNKIFNSLLKNKDVKKVVVTSKPKLNYNGHIEIQKIVYRNNYDNFLKNLDAIIVATPPEHHENILYMSKRYNLPALFEKPLTNSVETLKKISNDDYFKTYIDVDYIYLYSNLWKVYVNNIFLDNSKPIFIELWSGNKGPMRSNINIFWDWLPHDFSMLFSLTNIYQFNIEDINLIKDMKGKYYKIFLQNNNVKVEINVGNQMINRMRSCKVINNNKTVCFNDVTCQVSINNTVINVKSKQTNLSPLENVLNSFVSKLKNSEFRPDQNLNFSYKVNYMIKKVNIFWINKVNLQK